MMTDPSECLPNEGLGFLGGLGSQLIAEDVFGVRVPVLVFLGLEDLL